MPIGATQDAAELRRRFEDLQSRLGRAHRLTMLGTLLGSIVHEFNNILTPVMSYAEMAMDAPNDPVLVRKAVERAYHGCDRASRIASAILAFAAGNQESGEVREADVKSVVGDTLLCMASDPAKAGITVSTHVGAACLAAIDPVTLQQVLLNLVINAIKAMKPRGGRLAIRARSGAHSTWHIADARTHGPTVTIEVEDTGCGMDQSTLDSVFEPFVSHSRSIDQSGERKGTGLGLTICRQLIEAAGGRIHVESQVNAGTCFTIVLPGVERGQAELKATA